MKLKTFMGNRKGTAEVIGTIMFVMILVFFFTNVYIWHDQNVREMNSMYVAKMNAGMQVTYNSTVPSLAIIATGSNVDLSRLWIDSAGIHTYANLEHYNITLQTGAANAVKITFTTGIPTSDGNGGFNVTVSSYNRQTNTVTVKYSPLPSNPTFTIVNTMGIAVST